MTGSSGGRGAGADQPGQPGRGLLGGQGRIVQQGRAGMPLTRMGLRVLCQPGRAAAWQVGTAAGEHDLANPGPADSKPAGHCAELA